MDLMKAGIHTKNVCRSGRDTEHRTLLCRMLLSASLSYRMLILRARITCMSASVANVFPLRTYLDRILKDLMREASGSPIKKLFPSNPSDTNSESFRYQINEVNIWNTAGVTFMPRCLQLRSIRILSIAAW